MVIRVAGRSQRGRHETPAGLATWSGVFEGAPLTDKDETMEHSRQVQFDRQLLEVYLVGLQSEVEAKLREVTQFRENMKVLAVSRTPEGRGRQLEAVGKLTEQIDRMLGTNRVVRETLLELLEAAKALARDLRDEH